MQQKWIVLVLVLFLAGCSAHQSAYRKAEKDARRNDWDSAVLGYSKALALKPGNTRYSVALERAKLKASAQHFEKGKRYASAGQWELAAAEYQQTLLLHPGNQHAANELDRALRQLRRETAGPTDLELLKERAKRAAMGPPKLDPRSNIPILLQFKEVEVGKIFEAISKASQINFIFDEKVDLERPMTIDLGNVSLDKAMDILMLQTKNFFVVIDEHTILIAPDTRPKRQEYEDQVIRTFFLSNGDTKQVVTLLRSLLQSRQISENADLNSVTIKDTPATVAIAEKIINANDKAKGEVLIDVELLEINRTVVQNLGIDLTSKAISLTFAGGEGQEDGGGNSLTLDNLDQLKRKSNWLLGPIPGVFIEFLKSDSETRSIAKPQLRVTEGEKAQVLIGNRVPIPTTSFNTSQTIGGNIVPITSFTYQNVGITVQVEPRVHHNQEITLTVSVEISNVSGLVETQAGQSQPIIGTRQIETVIRLKDGETNVLAGLILRNDEDNRSGVPGIMDIPGVGRALSSNNTKVEETDIIMTLTPRIIRMPGITEEDLATLWVGTQENMRLRGPTTGPFGVTAFGNNGEPEVLPAVAAGGAAGAGSVSQITPSDEVERDRAAREREAETRRAGEERPTDPGQPRSAGGGAQQPVPQPGSDTGADDPGPDNTPTGPAVVTLVPSQTAFRVGDTVVVQVVINNGTNVGSVPFHLRYNRQVLEYTQQAQRGGFLDSSGQEPIFLANDAGGEVVVGLSLMGGREGASGSGVLATFTFVAVNPGDAGFAFTGASVKDPQARNLPASFITAGVTVEP
jgi:general secretion pathway protein D